MPYDMSQRDNLIIKHLPLVKKIVGRMDIKGSEFDQDDLISMGIMGLMDAIDKYDHSKNVPFEAYANLRIKGAIIDELRKSGRVSRDRISKLNEYYSAKEELERKLLRSPDEMEICNELGIDKKELSKLHETVHFLSQISLESTLFSKEGSNIPIMEVIKDEETLSPEEQYIKKEIKDILVKSISKLDEREQIILNLYYVEELSMKEISYILDISIPRISQIHGKILIKLREIMGPMLEAK
ncbi:sigma-70 family RNA polymerase sigma factor [Wansuia hejianensis]|nr:FliA/WhiG family RNA polymerase sigma factor [Wansuia hejianensis]